MINYLSCSIADHFYLNKIIEDHEKDIYIYGHFRCFLYIMKLYEVDFG